MIRRTCIRELIIMNMQIALQCQCVSKAQWSTGREYTKEFAAYEVDWIRFGHAWWPPWSSAGWLPMLTVDRTLALFSVRAALLTTLDVQVSCSVFGLPGNTARVAVVSHRNTNCITMLACNFHMPIAHSSLTTVTPQYII